MTVDHSRQDGREHLETLRNSLKRWPVFQRDQFSRAETCAHLTLDAVREPGLLERQEQLKTVSQTVESLRTRPMPLPEKYRVAVTVPDEAWEKRLEESVQKTNRIVLSKGLTGFATHQLFRLGSGVQGKVYPVELKKVVSGPTLHGEKERKIELELNLSGLSEDDLVKIASFTNRFIQK